ncbi:MULTISPECIES: hypothetical protein [Myxococcus]|uniref:hypothetical protein n=1 Tax=Myxococcus TaxID=32 RepID=UPI001141EAD4|nr:MULTISPECIES: hypothetical protein [Myxococcus]NOK00101.1 hypothetical protein [Myxococcus xanthus]
MMGTSGKSPNEANESAAWLAQRCASRTAQAAVVRSAVADGIVTPGPGTLLARELDASVLALADVLSLNDAGDEQRRAALRSEMAKLDHRYGEVLVQILRIRAGYVYPYMSGIGSPRPERVASLPHACGERLFAAEVENTIFGCGHRAFWVCASCGLVGESEAGCPLPDVFFEEHAARLQVDGAVLGEGDVFVGVVVEPFGSLQAETLHAGTVPPSSLLNGFKFDLRPDVTKHGLRVLAIALVYGCEFMVIRQPIRRYRSTGKSVLPHAEITSSSRGLFHSSPRTPIQNSLRPASKLKRAKHCT